VGGGGVFSPFSLSLPEDEKREQGLLRLIAIFFVDPSCVLHLFFD